MSRPPPPRRRLDLSAEPDVIYAIGDIHGCINELRDLEARIVDDGDRIHGNKLLIYMGDYVDRGPDSAAVLDHLTTAPPAGFQRVCLCGNHEEVLLKMLASRQDPADWLQFGGVQTMLSYGFDLQYLTSDMAMKPSAVIDEFVGSFPPRHFDFLRTLPIVFTTPRYFFAHAGARPGIALSEQSEHDLLWIRDAFLGVADPGFAQIIVHGHTTSLEPVSTAVRIGVDTGAYRGGALTAARIVAGDVSFLQSAG